MRRYSRLLFAAAALACACAVSHEPRLVSVPQPGLRPVSRLDQIFDYRTAAATVVAISERELGFPPFPVTFRFYAHQDAFEKALLGVGYEPALARATANTMTAVGGHRGVMLNEMRLAMLPWGERVALLAHEMGHSLQYELGGGRRGTSDQWLREGFAEWLAVRVVERLDRVSLAAIRSARQSDVRTAGRAKVPPLADLVTFPQWVRAGERQGPAIYALSFVAVDLLLERHGVPAVVEYFKRFAVSEDRIANFRAAFGEDIDAFEAALSERVWRR
jgi:hypothetical protein